MPIDPQIIAGIKTPQVQNPLAMVGDFARLQNTVNQNQLFQSTQAAGQAYQSAIDPTTGKLDIPTFNRLVAGNPLAAMAVPQEMSRGQALQSAQQTRGLQAQAAVNQGIASLLTMPDDQLNGDVIRQKIASLTQAGAISPQDAQAAESDLPPDGSPPSAYRAYGVKHLAANLGGPEQAQGLFGSPVPITNGQTLQGGVQAGFLTPNRGAITPVGPATPIGYPSRGELGAQQTSVAYDKNGNPIPVATTQAQRLIQQNAGAALGGPAALDVNAAQTLGTGRPQPAGAAGQSASALPPGAVPTGMAIGSPEAIAADVGKFKEAQAALPAAQTAVQSLQKAQHALELSNTGRGTEAVHNMYAFLQAQGIPTPGLSNASDVANYDLAHKYLLDYARQQGAAAKTDLQLQTSEGANASTGISQAAALNVVKTNIGRERQKIAQVTEAPNPNGLGYGAHASTFANSTDPRGFAIDSYTPTEVSNMVSSMTPAEKTKFYKSVGIAQRLKLLNVPPPPANAPAAQMQPTTTLNPGPGGA